MKRSHFLSATFINVILLAFGCNANAALLERDWEFSPQGNHLLTIDTNTQLEWLDLTVTAGLSKEAVLSLLSVDPQFTTFRYATISEWQSLVEASGISLSLMGGYHSELYDPVVSLMSMLGTTYFTIGDNNATQGMLADQYGTCCARRTYMEIRHDSGDVARVIDNWSYPVWQQAPQIGSYLVRAASPVPEPRSVALFVCGITIVALASRRRFLALVPSTRSSRISRG